MNNLKEDIENYLERTKSKRIALAREAGVNPSIITRILRGTQKDVTANNYLKIKGIVGGGDE